MSWPTGVFSFLTGFVEEGETPDAAVVREVKEELGLTTHSAELIGHFPLRQLNQLIIAYTITATGEVTLSDELVEAKAVSETELAEFDFGPLELTSEIVQAWLKRRERVPAPNNELERARDG